MIVLCYNRFSVYHIYVYLVVPILGVSMFKSLSEKLLGSVGKLSSKSFITEDDVQTTMREVRMSLLEADVSLVVVKDLVGRIKSKALGARVLKSVSPYQMVVKIVHDELVMLLEGDGKLSERLKIDVSPSAIMMVGLQGAGKTTTTAKLARHLRDKYNKKVLMVSLDVYRPAAMDQLSVLGAEDSIDVLPVINNQSVEDIAKRAITEANKNGYDVVLFDTAGRLHVNLEMMDELKKIEKITDPNEIFIVADGMSGQDAVTVAKHFNEYIDLTGIILSRMDGDARGGAALSMRYITGKPIRFVGTGEKIDALEVFHPRRIAGRILGMGDIVSLVEKAGEVMKAEAAERQMKRMMKGKFDFNDLRIYLEQIQNMGGAGAVMDMLPGLGAGNAALKGAADAVDNSVFIKQSAIIMSMTKSERKLIDPLNASRKKRIALGAGVSLSDVNQLVKVHRQFATMIKKLSGMNLGSLAAKGLGGMFGGRDKMASSLGSADGGDSMMPPNLSMDDMTAVSKMFRGKMPSLKSYQNIGSQWGKKGK